jgi:phage-related protein
MATITNQDIISKLATLEANFNNLTSDFKDMKDDVKQIKKETANFGLIKSIVFGIVIIVMLAFMGGLINIIIPHATTQASTLPETGVHTPVK